MKKAIYILTLCTALGSCSKEFMKKENGSFKADGASITADENLMSAGYSSSTTLDIRVGGSKSSVELRVDLTKINQTVSILSKQEGFVYTDISGKRYLPVSGQYVITSHKSGNPASMHTEGTFTFLAKSESGTTDFVNISEGKFYVNNY